MKPTKTQIALFAFALLVLASCGTTKETRRMNRAARLVEKARVLAPQIIEGREVTLPVRLETRAVHGGIAVRTPVVADSLRLDFADDRVAATVTIAGDSARLDYVVRPMAVDTAVTVRQYAVQPTVVETRGCGNWWIWVPAAVAVIAVIAVIRFALNFLRL